MLPTLSNYGYYAGYCFKTMVTILGIVSNMDILFVKGLGYLYLGQCTRFQYLSYNAQLPLINAYADVSSNT